MGKNDTPRHVRVLRRAVPQILLLILLTIYMAVSVVVFQALDENMANCSRRDIIMFEFGTLTTIGYGNIAPSTDYARVFCIGFALVGIPMMLLALANFGKHTAKAFWHVLHHISIRSARSKVSKDTPMPLSAVFILFLITILIGSLFVHNNAEATFVDQVYFSFISFTTVGFGDRIPLVDNLPELTATVFYLTWGILLTTALFTLLNEAFRKIHYLGRRFTGARDVTVWVGGKRLAVSQLIQIVADEFQASPREVRRMLHDLDDLLPKAVAVKNEKKVPIVTHLEDFDCYE